MFRRFDPEFPARAEEWGGGIVVGGHNYGQGSSREQAAFAALHLGRACGRRQELCPHPPHEPDRAGDPAADLRRRGGLRASCRGRRVDARRRSRRRPRRPLGARRRDACRRSAARALADRRASARSCSRAAWSPTPRSVRRERLLLGGCALGLADGVERRRTPVQSRSSSRTAYGVGLATVGLFTTALFVTHLAMQIPGGRASDRFGARRVGLLGLVVIAVLRSTVADRARSSALDARHACASPVSAPGSRFIAGSAYVRAQRRLAVRAGPLRRCRPRRAAGSRSRSCRRSRTGSAGGLPSRRRSCVALVGTRSARGGAARRSAACRLRERGASRAGRPPRHAALPAGRRSTRASLGLSVVVGQLGRHPARPARRARQGHRPVRSGR